MKQIKSVANLSVVFGIVFTTLLSVSAVGQAQIQKEKSVKQNCTKGKTRISVGLAVEVEAAEYCYNLDQHTFFSRNCKKLECVQNLDMTHVNKDQLFGQYGTPGARLCIQLGGRAELLEYYANKSWQKTDRCIFKNSEFVDLGSLYGYYLKNVLNGNDN